MNGNTKVLDQYLVSGTQVQPQAPVGVASKEIGRVVAPVSEFVTRSGTERVLNIPPEVSAHIKVENDNPALTEEHEKIGVAYAGPSVQPPTGPSGLVQVPLTREEALADLKIRKPTDSGWGLDKLILKALDALGFKGL